MENEKTSNRKLSEQWFVLPLPPSDNDRLIYAKNIKRFVLSPDYREYKRMAAVCLLKQKTQPFEGPVEVTVKIYRKDKRRDMNSFDKSLFDVLEGVAYLNDKQMVCKHMTLDDTQKDNPRAVVSVRAYETR